MLFEVLYWHESAVIMKIYKKAEKNTLIASNASNKLDDTATMERNLNMPAPIERIKTYENQWEGLKARKTIIENAEKRLRAKQELRSTTNERTTVGAIIRQRLTLLKKEKMKA